MAHLAAKLDSGLAFDPGEIVGEFERISILCLGPLIERRAGQAGVPGPAKVGEGADIERSLGLLHAFDPRVFIEVSSQQVRSELDEPVKHVEPEFVEQRGTQIARDAGGVILSARIGIRDAQRRRIAGLAQLVVIEAIAEKYLVAVAEAVIDARSELVFVENRGRRESKSPSGHGRRREVWVEERGLRRQPRGRNTIARERHASRAGGRIVDGVRHRAEIAGKHACSDRKAFAARRSPKRRLSYSPPQPKNLPKVSSSPTMNSRSEQRDSSII